MNRILNLQFQRSFLKQDLLLKLQTPAISNLNFSLHHNFSKKIQQKTDFTKLVFDSENKCVIFDHVQGENELRWMVRISTAFTLINTFLTAQEYSYPIFGGWNGLSFGLCTLVGYGILSAINVYSKRTVKTIKLYRSGDFVELLFYNAFWTPQSKVIHISEFANMQPSYFNYSRSELVTYGKVWINLEKNTYAGNKVYEDILIEILNGKPQKLESPLASKAKKIKARF